MTAKYEVTPARRMLGLITGAVAGTMVFPVVGTVAGGVFGWYAAEQIGPGRQVILHVPHNTRRVLRNCDQARETAQTEIEHIQRLLA